MSPSAATFVDRMGIAAESDGLSPIAARLFGSLLLSPEPRSLDDLAASLGVSKASVSTDARRLLERRIVERVPRPGDRRDYYELAPDFFAQIIRSRVARWRHLRDLAHAERRRGGPLDHAVRERLDTIDSIHAIVIDRLEQALAEWDDHQGALPPRRAPGRRAARAAAARKGA